MNYKHEKHYQHKMQQFGDVSGHWLNVVNASKGYATNT